MKVVTTISVEDTIATKRKSYKAYKNLKENLLYFPTFDITNISQAFTRKSHIETPG
jgi:hypothetical protein